MTAGLQILLVLAAELRVRSSSMRRHTATDGSVREYNPETKSWLLVECAIDEAGSDEVLYLEGPRFDIAGGFVINSVPIVVRPPAAPRELRDQQDADTGRTTWDGAIVLAKYLETAQGSRRDLRGASVLELGAGTGLAGLSAAALGAAVLLTDLGYCVPQLESNADGFTGPGSVRARELDWAQPAAEVIAEPFDLVIGADIVWLPHLVRPLVRVFEMLLEAWKERAAISGASSKQFEVLLAHQTRSTHTDNELFALLSGRFRVSVLSQEDMPAGFRHEKVRLLSVSAMPSIAKDLL